MYLYAVRDKSTNKLVCNITNPRRKFWEKRGSAVAAINNYNPRYHNPRSGKLHNPSDLQLVVFELTEVQS